MSESEYITQATSALKKLLVNETIRDVRPLTRAERAAWDWDRGGFAIETDTGIVIYASQDDEGNGPGAIMIDHPDGACYSGATLS